MKSIKNQPNLYRTESAYYYRKPIPDDMRDVIGKTEHKKVLKGDYLSAKRQTALLNSALGNFFDIIRRMKPTGEDIKTIVRNYFEKLLIDAESQMWLDSEVQRGYEPEDHDGLSAEERIASFEKSLRDIRDISQKQEYEANYFDLAKELLESRGFTFHQISPTTYQLYKGLTDAQIEALRIAIAVRKGESEHAEIRHPLLKDCRNFLVDPDIDIAIENEGLPYYKTKATSIDLEQAIQKYVAALEQKTSSADTLKDIENALILMSDTIGIKKLLPSVNIEDCRKVRDLLAHIPKHFGKKYKAKGMTLTELMESGEDYERLSLPSQNKYWQWIKSFFGWCVEEGYLKESPIRTLKVQKSKASIHDRDMFSDHEIKAYFSSPQFTGHKSESRRSEPGDKIIKDGKYWTPLIAYYAGMRLGEIVQLQIADIKYDEGVPYIDVNDAASFKTVKTEQSKRVIPLHPELIKMGFVDYAEQCRSKRNEAERLFPDFKISDGRRISHEASKYFSRYMDNIGLKREKLAFHSFRHNFVQGMRDARIDRDRMDALDGRNTGFKEGSNTRRNYGRPFTAKDLYPDICKISYGVDLSHLYKN